MTVTNFTDTFGKKHMRESSIPYFEEQSEVLVGNLLEYSLKRAEERMALRYGFLVANCRSKNAEGKFVLLHADEMATELDSMQDAIMLISHHEDEENYNLANDQRLIAVDHMREFWKLFNVAWQTYEESRNGN